jgi:superfamily II helicase
MTNRKTCPCCKEEKNITAFYQYEKYNNLSYCKECWKERMKDEYKKKGYSPALQAMMQARKDITIDAHQNETINYIAAKADQIFKNK